MNYVDTKFLLSGEQIRPAKATDAGSASGIANDPPEWLAEWNLLYDRLIEWALNPDDDDESDWPTQATITMACGLVARLRGRCSPPARLLAALDGDIVFEFEPRPNRVDSIRCIDGTKLLFRAVEDGKLVESRWMDWEQ